MFTARNFKIFFLFSILVFIASCSTTQTQISESSNCHSKRAAIDLGSGSTKLVIGLVNTCENIVEGILFEAQRALALKDQLQKSKDNKFNKATINKLTSIFEEFKYLAQNEGITEVKAVATSAFRTAKNGKEAAKSVFDHTGVQIQIISQQQEAKFAYSAALSKLKKDGNKSKSPIAVWDIGGGSMQITKPLTSGEKKVALLKIASVTFKNMVLKEFYPESAITPNPMTEERALKAMDLARVTAKEQLNDFETLKGYSVVGVGGVHYFSLGSQFKESNRVYNQSTLLNTLLKRSKLNDQEIGGKYSQTDITNIALVLGFMQTLKVDEVRPLKINMAHGLLVEPSFWN